MAELGALEAMAVQGAPEAMVELGALEAMAELGAQEAMADGLRGLGLGPLGPAPKAGTYTTPPKKIPWGSEGVSEPSRAKQTGQYKTRQERPPRPDRQDRTGQPTGTGSPPGLARRLRLLLGMTRSQRPSQGPSATASTSTTRGQAARMASMATTRGAACPRRVSVDKTRFFKMFLWAQHDLKTALLAVTCGLDPRG